MELQITFYINSQIVQYCVARYKSFWGGLPNKESADRQIRDLVFLYGDMLCHELNNDYYDKSIAPDVINHCKELFPELYKYS